MATTDPRLDDDDVGTYFLGCLSRSIELSLAAVRQAAGPLSAVVLGQALHVLSFALALDSAWPEAQPLVLALAPHLERDGLREELRALLVSALQRSEDLADRATEAELRWHLGVLHHLQAEYDAACAQLEASAALFAELGARRDQARALDRLAYTAQTQRRLAEAEQFVEQARSLLAAGDPEHAYRLIVLGSVALARRHWHRARLCFAQAFCLLGAGDDLRMLAWASVNLGVAHVQLERYREAMTWYLRSIDLFELVDDPVHRAVAQMNLGVVYALTGQPAQAVRYYAQAEPVFHRTADVRRRAMVYNNLGYAYGLQERWADAEPAYQLAVQLHREAGNIAGMVDSMDGLAQSIESQGRPGEAMAVLQNALEELERMEAGSGRRYLREVVTARLAGLTQIASS